jgi:hypothetical protein
MARARLRDQQSDGTCLAYVRGADERVGLWGGTLPEERRDMRLRVAITSPANLITAASRLSA